MVINRQLWSPDTCGCIVEETWDSENLEKPHELRTYVYQCPDHIGYTYENMRSENQKKNLVLKHLIEDNLLPITMIEVSESVDFKTRQKNSTKQLHNRIVYNYYFEPGTRKFIFSLEGLDKNGNIINLSNAVKTSVSNILDRHFGSGTHQMVDILHEELHPQYRAALKIRNGNNNEERQKAEQRFRDDLEKELRRQNTVRKIKDFFT